MNHAIEFEREDDGRWIAEIVAIPGALAYGWTQLEAESKVQAIALRVLAEKLERAGDAGTDCQAYWVVA